ncbi:MAG: DUF4271 domain-containing protein [Bacteroidales bacterium]
MSLQDTIAKPPQSGLIYFLAEEGRIDSVVSQSQELGQRPSVFENHALESSSPINPLRVDSGFVPPGWIVIIFLVQLLISGIVLAVFRQNLKMQLSAVFSVNSQRTISKEGSPFFQLPTLLLLLVYSLSLSTFVFVSTRAGYGEMPLSDRYFFLFLFGGIFFFSMLKLMIFSLIGEITCDIRSNALYMSNMVSYAIFMGLLIMPLVFFYTYRYSGELFNLILGIVVLALVVRAIRGIILTLKQSSLTSVYIILYLCTFEIFPLIGGYIGLQRCCGALTF